MKYSKAYGKMGQLQVYILPLFFSILTSCLILGDAVVLR